MIPFKNIKTIFFDYDGTLHNSIKIYGPAFTKAYNYLVEEGIAEKHEWEEKDISCWLGFNSHEMWQKFMPELSENMRERCSRIIGKEMERLIDSGKPELYEGVIEVLQYLKHKSYHLIFISNCGIYYRDAHKKMFNLDRYFDDMLCSEEYSFVPKHEILKRVKDKYPAERIIIGDRFQDIEAGKRSNIYTIGCSYGYAAKDELQAADLIIDDIGDIKKYF